MKVLCLEKLRILSSKQDESIRKALTLPFGDNSSLGLKS